MTKSPKARLKTRNLQSRGLSPTRSEGVKGGFLGNLIKKAAKAVSGSVRS